MQVTMKVEGLNQALDIVRSFSDRRANAAAATALTRTVAELRSIWAEQLRVRLDRPTPATVNAPRIRTASAASLTAEVYIRDSGGSLPPVEWLKPEEEGGPRRLKRFEQAMRNQGALPPGYYMVPGPAAKLDGYGNVSRGQIVQVIAQLGAKFSPGYQRVISASASRRAAKALKTGRGYVAITERKKGLPMGVYERKGRGLAPVFFFVRAVSYRPRTGLVELARQQAPAIFKRQYERAVNDSAARLAARGG